VPLNKARSSAPLSHVVRRVTHVTVSNSLSAEQRCPLLHSSRQWRRVVSCKGNTIAEQRAVHVIGWRWSPNVQLNSWHQVLRRHDPEESTFYSRSCHNLKFRTSRLELFMRPILWERFEGCNSEGVCCVEVSVRARAVWAWLIACSAGCCCCQIFRSRLHWNDAVNLAVLSRTNTHRDVYILISNFTFVVPDWRIVLWHYVYLIRYVCVVPWLAIVCCGVTVGSQSIYTAIFSEFFITYSCPLLYSAP
jgi:hypothetical protein